MTSYKLFSFLRGLITNHTYEWLLSKSDRLQVVKTNMDPIGENMGERGEGYIRLLNKKQRYQLCKE